LVYDFLLPGQMRKHVNLLRDMDNISFASSVWTTHLISMYGFVPWSEEVDLSCPARRKTFLMAMKACHITKERMDGNYLSSRLDRQRHAWVHALESNHCQHCYYVWANEFDDVQRVLFKFKKQNKTKIIQCLVCNVNLCCACDHTFHAVEMTSSAI
jgi:hypothetical protein